MNDPIERYKALHALHNAVTGNITQKDIDILCGRPLTEAPSRDSYDEIRTIPKEELKGRRVEVSYGSEKALYIADAWISGKGISLEKTYRILSETETEAEVASVSSGQERQKVIAGLEDQIRQIVRKNKA